ncbi:hypothetical protein [Streptosporangium sp. NPDC002524]|uniref:hypothetical protein n=1 Tax=Streptosporangium sp. NPDC002524 TaxID=3154537 RepID=UPI003329DF4F
MTHDQDVLDDYRRQEQAARLGWTAAHAAAVSLAAAGELHQDGRGFYRSGVRGGRGRAVSRTRVQVLEAAGFLTTGGGPVTLTADGRQALIAWNAVDVAPAAEEAKELPPLYGGQEAARRYQVWQANMARGEAESRARLQEAIAVAEASYQAEQVLLEQRAAERAGRRFASAAAAWDAINGPAEAFVYTDDGTVETHTGVSPEDLDAHTVPAPRVAPVAPLRRLLPTRPARRPLVRPAAEQRRPRTLTRTHPGGHRVDRPHRGQPPRLATR